MIETSTQRGTPVRIGLVGLGGHGRTIQSAVEAASGLEVVAVFDPDEAEAARAARRFGCEAAPSYEGLLARDDLDAVSLCSPNFVHRTQAEAAFAAGLDVFVEKPLANTLPDARRMVEAAERARRLLMVGHNMRFGEAVRWGRRQMEVGRLGEVVSVEAHFSSDTALQLPGASWRLRPEQAPLLPMMQLGIHAVDLVHHLVGPVREVVAQARGVTTPEGVVDNVVATVALESGVLGTVVSNYCSPVRFAFRIAGTEGALFGTPLALTFEPRGGGAAETHDASADAFASYTAQMDAFAAAVQTRTPPETDGWAGMEALAVVEAMASSVARHGPVTVPVLRPTTAVGHAL